VGASDIASGVVGEARVTPVDVLLSFAVERRWYCNACGGLGVSFEHDSMLRLPAPPSSTRARSLPDLYTRSCVGGQAREVPDVCAFCGCAVVQRRMATMPSVLLPQLCRVVQMVVCFAILSMLTSLWIGQGSRSWIGWSCLSARQAN
jgi:hypothetical protein